MRHVSPCYRLAIHPVTMHAMTLPLSIDSICALRRPAAQQVAIRLVAETGSTNADLLAGVAHLAGPTLLLTEAQTAGKGRAGRTWHSEPGATLTFSLAWKFSLPVQALLGLSPAVGVVVAEVLAQFDVNAQLKWPNDVLLEGKKIAGILIETAAAKGSAGAHIWAVIGIGINIVMPDSLAERIGRPVAAAPNLLLDRNRVVAALLNSLAEALDLFEQQGFQAFMTRWNALHAYAGEQVAIIDRDRTLHEGTALGIDDSGRLLMDSLNGQITVIVGDVSLRPLQSLHARDA
jgi:BirA family biotin operon repressor/biotin-[acetyl-CoA-carboxylase] ligase